MSSGEQDRHIRMEILWLETRIFAAAQARDRLWACVMLGIQLAANTVALDMFVEWKSFLKWCVRWEPVIGNLYTTLKEAMRVNDSVHHYSLSWDALVSEWRRTVPESAPTLESCLHRAFVAYTAEKEATERAAEQQRIEDERVEMQRRLDAERLQREQEEYEEWLLAEAEAAQLRAQEELAALVAREEQEAQLAAELEEQRRAAQAREDQTRFRAAVQAAYNEGLRCTSHSERN